MSISNVLIENMDKKILEIEAHMRGEYLQERKDSNSAMRLLRGADGFFRNLFNTRFVSSELGIWPGLGI